MTRCKKCNKELTGGFYNAPSGAFCTKCWENKSEVFKNRELKTALKQKATIVKAFGVNSIDTEKVVEVFIIS